MRITHSHFTLTLVFTLTRGLFPCPLTTVNYPMATDDWLPAPGCSLKKCANGGKWRLFEGFQGLEKKFSRFAYNFHGSR